LNEEVSLGFLLGLLEVRLPILL